MGTKSLVKLADADTSFFPGSDGGGTVMRFTIDKATNGAESFAMMVNQIAPGTQDGAGVHTHDSEHGFYILRGEGRYIVGDEEFVASPGDSVFIRANVPHLVSNNGDKPFEYVVIYAPQGPEIDLRARFLKK